jgi:UDP:flavonoid glycosyltransferase YjiC (YdhE family)
MARTTVAPGGAAIVREHPHRKDLAREASGFVMRVLMTTKRGAGHFGPLIPFARAFRRAGDTVLIAAPNSALPMVRAEGFSTWLFDEAPEDERDEIFAITQQLPEEERGPYVISEAFIRLDARAALPGMRDVCRRWNPDIVVSEITELAGPLVAEALGIPTVCVGIVQQGKGDAVMQTTSVMRAIDELRAELGLADDRGGERFLSAPYFTLMPEALEDPATPGSRSPWRFRDLDAPYSGAHTDRFAGDERPLVYLTFGSVAPTMDYFPDVYRGAIDSFSALPVRVLVTVGRDRDPAELGPVPANVQVERWIPQREVMPHAAAMVCHGGSGTVTMGLAAGVPMAVVPLFADQPYNAERVAAIAAGIAIDGGPQGVARLGDAVSKLLVDPAYRANAERVADEMRSLPSVDTAPAIARAIIADRPLAAIV